MDVDEATISDINFQWMVGPHSSGKSNSKFGMLFMWYSSELSEYCFSTNTTFVRHALHVILLLNLRPNSKFVRHALHVSYCDSE